MTKKKSTTIVSNSEVVSEDVVKQEIVKEVTEKNEEVTKKNAVEMSEFYKAEIKKKEEEIKEILDPEELKKQEEDLMKIFNEAEEELRNKVYDLPNDVVFVSRKYSRKDIGRFICRFLDRYETEYKATLGLYELYKIWINPPVNLKFGEYDTTLRMLGQFKYKGFNDWENILIIIEFFKQCNDEYAKDIMKYDYLSEWHNLILSQMQLTSGHTPEADALEGISQIPN